MTFEGQGLGKKENLSVSEKGPGGLWSVKDGEENLSRGKGIWGM